MTRCSRKLLCFAGNCRLLFFFLFFVNSFSYFLWLLLWLFRLLLVPFSFAFSVLLGFSSELEFFYFYVVFLTSSGFFGFFLSFSFVFQCLFGKGLRLVAGCGMLLVCCIIELVWNRWRGSNGPAIELIRGLVRYPLRFQTALQFPCFDNAIALIYRWQSGRFGAGFAFRLESAPFIINYSISR